MLVAMIERPSQRDVSSDVFEGVECGGHCHIVEPVQLS